MDTTDPDIFFDSSGVCNHCRETEPLFAKIRFSEEEAQRNLQAIADEIKGYGQGLFSRIWSESRRGNELA